MCKYDFSVFSLLYLPFCITIRMCGNIWVRDSLHTFSHRGVKFAPWWTHFGLLRNLLYCLHVTSGMKLHPGLRGSLHQGSLNSRKQLLYINFFVYTHYFTLGWYFASGCNIFCLHASFTLEWNLYILTPGSNFLYVLLRKTSFSLPVEFNCLFTYEKQLFSSWVEMSPLYLRPGWNSPSLLRVNNRRDFLRGRSDFTPGWDNTCKLPLKDRGKFQTRVK